MHAATTVYLASKASGLPPTAPTATPAAASPVAAGVRKVLVVDDERDLADLAGALLECQGLAAIVVYSASDAMDVLASHDDIDALFSDIMMPGMTGLQLADAVRARYPAMHIVLTSGYTAPALLAGQHGSYPFLAKPYSMDMVVQTLNAGSASDDAQR